MLFVADVMTTKLVTLSPSDSLKTAREIMQKARIRHLPILSPHGGFVGLLSQRDLLKASVSHFADVQPDVREQIEAGIPVSEVMAAEVLTIPPDMPLSQAGEILLARKIGCLPVLECGQLRGILTESDFVKLCLVLLSQEQSEPEDFDNAL
ncbi:CBS domain-containing protein [Desulfovibrio sp. OttesenSCG-928-F20]|nr:CBS domain-containing protein [Desulfovibrio sp. OttesenSCG-928-M16]MDL2290573.1 CBS domain-containing protein [Desulfovibrio sp. OttesenSCG-928-F20]